MPNLLLEIGVEEIPAGYIGPALRQMEELFTGQIEENRLSFKGLHVTGTPRRLILSITGLPEIQENIIKEIKGPSSKFALDEEGLPTKAAIGFAHSQGIDANDLKVKDTGRGEYCFAIKEIAGKRVFDLLPDMLSTMIKSITFPKSMRWKTGRFSFARPIRTILALFDNDIIQLELNGIKAGRKTDGHQFLSDKILDVETADYGAYKELLRNNYVIIEIDERRKTIRDSINTILSRHGSQLDDEGLLNEVVNLVEFPCAVKCSFEKEYLEIPPEVVITSMKEHQRYFPVTDQDNNLLPEFIVILDRKCDGNELPRRGNERVLKARLADAKFFWNEDRKVSLQDRVESLGNLVFHENIGSYLERGERIGKLAHFISTSLSYPPSKLRFVERASLLCKADLLTEMVGEFPKLQGIMGREYALEKGEDAEVAKSIAEHYLPRYAKDLLPETETGIVLSLADKFDVIAGCFSTGLVPTGSLDPYALRRQTQGIIRILEEKELNIKLSDIIESSLSSLKEKITGRDTVAVHQQIMDFFKDRLRHNYLERGFRYDIIDSVLKSGYDNISDFSFRLKIVTKISQSPIWHSLVTVVERTYNIGKSCTSHGNIDENLLKEEEEKVLWNIYEREKDKMREYIKPRKYEELSLLYNEVFAEPIHNFFENVYVNVDDEALKGNRLLLMKKINELYVSHIANLALIVEHE
ncbi:MAG: glycine--tRNA ligase subunit beta [Candidatus Scalindua sp. AMX11]|nr:MAG: glycine--tRNA ligase subunit beta [Candidatus Scalindua sp.]NOG83854.1 glycine--tRNA ligase subunit beta [Planctomycetota bacterium]RZV83003.1 MAG: glycine--tRNA ligase subunit beta [Candidatus Scalindua sp. SCAELEC01]TDE64507.1 MAG: glycine--tRNA ligase subunit beta [Candidatus Scalindua sp. AMX11]GJQ58753.1 MAG: glycine--tRNA ligase beta subunit [Candidatus Scalindua sp.]